MRTLDGFTGISMDQVRAARLVVAGISQDADELALLLDMLGIGRVVSPAILSPQGKHEGKDDHPWKSS